MEHARRSLFDMATSNTTSNRGGRHHRLKIAGVENQAISDLVPFSGLILTCWVALLVMLSHYVFTPLFLRYYRRIYLDLDEEKRRSFLNHHIGGLIKVVILLAGVYPWVHVLFVGSEDFKTPMAKGSHVQMGDVLIVLTELFIAMYVYELLWRIKLSPIAMAHHVGAIMIAQVAVVLSLRLEKEKAATYEYMLCLVWGAFDVIAEMWPNFAMIVYRTHNNNHHLLKHVFLVTAIITLLGTTAETILTIVFLASIWGKIDNAFRILTPILYTVFVLAQVHGSRILFTMYKKECRKIQQAAGDVETVSAVPKGEKAPEEITQPMMTIASSSK